MRLLTFNHHSIDESSTIDEVNEFFLELSKGIKKYILENGIKNSRFFTELENFIRYEIIVGYKIIDAIKSLSRDLQSIILDLITMRCNDDCLNKLSEEDEEKITDYEFIFPDEAPESDYMILSFAFEKNGILLSFNRDRWMNSTIEVLKYKDDKTDKAFINNIATEEHAEFHIKNSIIEKLPNENIIYSSLFEDWFLSHDTSTIDKIISKVNEAKKLNFDIDGFLIKSIDKDIWQIKIGTLGGLQQSAIRVLFKKDITNIYILHGFVKQGGTTYDYSLDVELAKKNYEELKK
jgi:phage-related protein